MADEKKKTTRGTRGTKGRSTGATPPPEPTAGVNRLDVQPLLDRLKQPRSILGIGRIVSLTIAALSDGRVTPAEFDRIVDAAAAAMKTFGRQSAKQRREAREEDDVERAVGRRAHELAAERTGTRRRDREFLAEARKQVLAERAKAAASPTA